ncbi:DUF6336 family protein [Streptomyces luteogriseus]|uniref:DUF6336 family protein n=1 Tax=Streptomyces luteogriseus TaxID=68233 RepID=UPI0037BA1991
MPDGACRLSAATSSILPVAAPDHRDDGCPPPVIFFAVLRGRQITAIRARTYGKITSPFLGAVMRVDDDPVITPQLRLNGVVWRGALLGLLGTVPLAVTALCIADHHDRQFLSIVSGIGLFGACLFVVGAGFWWASGGDIRRWRDWRSITGQTGVVGGSGERVLVVVAGVAVGVAAGGVTGWE